MAPEQKEQTERNPIDVLAEDFAEKCRRGLSPSVDDYVAQYPHLEKQIRELLPTVAMMEQLKKPKKREITPERIGEYQILREIGRGGMGVVYEAEHKALGRHVALKVAAPHLLREPVRLERFKREAQAAARLHHTNIVPVFGAGDNHGQHYIVMQYITGCGLNEILYTLRNPTQLRSGPVLTKIPKQNEPSYWKWIAQIGVQVAEALNYAHEQGTLHRDIKPGNILLDARGNAWVADFGLAKIVGRDNLTQTGEIIGTVQYMAPEALRSQADARSDIYGLALTLYELATLQLPYKEMNMLDLLQCIGENPPPKPRTLNPHVPPDLESIILKGSHRNIAERYQNAGEMAADLRRFIEDRPIAARPIHAPERILLWCRRNRAITLVSATAAALVLCALIGGWAGYVSTRGARESESQHRADAAIAQKLAEETIRLSMNSFDDIYNQFDSFDEPAGGPGPRRPEGDGPPRSNPVDGPPRRDNKPSAQIWQSMLNFYEGVADKYENSSTLQFEALKARARAGEIQLRLSDFDKAMESARRAIPTASKLHDDAPEKDEYAEILGQLHGLLGNALQRRRQFASAEDSHRKALALRAALAEKFPREERHQLELARQRFALGECLANREKLSEARTLIESSINAILPAIERDPRLRGILNKEYNCLADVLSVLGDTEGAANATQSAKKYAPRQPRDFRPGDRPPPPDFDSRDRRRPE